MKCIMSFLLVATSLACLPICVATSAPPPRPRTTAATKYDFSETSSSLGNKLLLDLLKQNKGTNVLISPASIHLALTMLANGADNSTLDEIAKVLGTDANNVHAMNQAAEDFLAASVSSDPNTEIEFANGVFSQKGYTLEPQFLKALQKHLHARAKELNFKTNMQGAIDAINQWVDRQTNGKIPTIFNTLDPNTKLVVANAVYMKAKWYSQFRPENTKNRPFFTQIRKSKNVSTMLKHETMSYMATTEFQAVSLPYTDTRYRMYVFLPAPGTTLEDLILSLTPSTFTSHLGQFKDAFGLLYLPRVNVSYSQQLNEPLKKLGMKLAFDDLNADLSKVFANKGAQLSVDRVAHQAMLTVNEEGTEAAAVTTITVVRASAPPPNEFTMDVNRPFLMIIRDDQTGATLFTAAISDPSK